MIFCGCHCISIKIEIIKFEFIWKLSDTSTNWHPSKNNHTSVRRGHTSVLCRRCAEWPYFDSLTHTRDMSLLSGLNFSYIWLNAMQIVLKFKSTHQGSFYWRKWAFHISVAHLICTIHKRIPLTHTNIYIYTNKYTHTYIFTHRNQNIISFL